MGEEKKKERVKKKRLENEQKMKELVFPLTDDQLKMVTNEHHLRMLMDEMTHFGQIGVDEGCLKLLMPADKPTIGPIHRLEKRLGVLLTQQEIEQIRRGIKGDDNGGDSKSIKVLNMNDRDFFNEMMTVAEKGTKFVKHKKGGVYDERYVLIHNDRLYWKERQSDRNKRERSMHLTKIIQVMIGKNTKALRHEALADISPQCCFSVVAKKATLDLSTPTLDPLAVRTFTSYLKGMQRHFIEQQTRYAKQNPHGRGGKRSRSHHNKERRHNDRSHHNEHHNRQHHDRNASSSAPPPAGGRERTGSGSGGGMDPKMSISPLQERRESEVESRPKAMKLSPIGQGFDGFKFDDDTVNSSRSKPTIV